MKAIVKFLSYLKSLDIKLWTKDNQLHCSAPEGVLTKILRIEIAERKAEIIAFLQNANAVEMPNIRHILPVSTDRDLPLSFNQQRLWLVEQIEFDSSAYNMPGAFRLKGFLKVAALEHSLNEIIKRHEVLRTTFSNINGQPSQVICSDVSLKLPVVDLQKLPKKQQEEEAQQLLIEEARLLFDLDRWPLLRCKLLRLGEKEHLLLLTAHHIVFDGWSFNIFCQELAILYEAFTTRKSLPLPELSIQYVDFAIWQREWFKDDVLEAQMLYWKHQLEGSTPLLQLPTDRLRPSVQTHRGACQSLSLSEDLTEALKTLSHQEGATLFMTLLAAFKALLHRYTDQEDILVGSPIAGRNRKELEGLIGFFVNTLVLRTSVSSHISFRELLSRVREVTLGAYAHQDIPLEKLLEELKLKRDLNHNPLFRVWFNMANVVDTSLELSGLTVETISSSETPAKFDLNLYVREQKQGIEFELVYNADLFESARMMEMLNQFECLLMQIARNPEKRVVHFSLVTSKAKQLLPNPTELLCSKWECSVHEHFSFQARRVPENLAIMDANESWNYEELDSLSNQLAHYLLANGIQRQDIVAIYGHRSASLVWALLGILKAGAAFVILDHAYPAFRLINCLRIAKPRVWLQLEAAGVISDALKEFVKTLSNCCRIKLPKCKAVAHEKFIGYSIDYPKVAVAPDDLAYIAFTSGTTGVPKGIMGGQKALSHFLQWYIQTFGLNELDRFSMLSGLSHDPLLRDIFTPLWLGATLYIPDTEKRGSFDLIVNWMKQKEIGVAHLTPAMGQIMTETRAQITNAKCDHSPLMSLRYAFFSGDILTKRHVSQIKRLAPLVTCVNFYGATETPQAMGYFIVPDQGVMNQDDELTNLKEIIPLGQGIADVQLLVLNTLQQLAGISEIGEIYVRTPYLAKGYIGDNALTEKRFIINPFAGIASDRVYKTGDLARYLPDGNIEFMGRIDNQVNLRGFRIELGEIELTLASCSGVSSVKVVSRENKLGNQQLVAYLVVNKEITTSRLRDYLKQKLPEHMLPSIFIQLEALPLTANGKVDFSALLKLEQNNTENKLVAPQTLIEKMLKGIWSEVLQVDQIGLYDNFFELGGNSLLVSKVTSRVYETFGIKLPFISLFESSTIIDLAKKIETSNKTELYLQGPKLVTIPKEVKKIPLSFPQERLLLFERWANEHSVPTITNQIHQVFRLTGSLNFTALEQSFNEIVRRHEVLRTNFAILKDKPVQFFTSSLQITIPIIDMIEIPEQNKEFEVFELFREEISRGFIRSQAPLLRFILVKLEEQEHIGVFIIDHLISDGWSMDILWKEMTLLYNAISQGLPSPLPPLPFQYSDFVYSQRQWLQGKVLEKFLSYWRQQLKGSEIYPYIELPIAKSIYKTQTFKSKQKSLVISSSLLQLTKNLCLKQEVTLFMLLLAIVKALLKYYTGRKDISVLVPVAGRYCKEIESMIGWFSNIVVMRTIIRNNDSFLELLIRIRKVVLEAYIHQGIPYAKLLSELGSNSRYKQYPEEISIPYVFFDLVSYAKKSEFLMKNLTVKPIKISQQTYVNSLSITVIEHLAKLEVIVRYGIDSFDDEVIDQLLEHFRIVTESVVVNTERRLSELKMDIW